MNPMNPNEYIDSVMKDGSPEVKALTRMEMLFAYSEARAIADKCPRNGPDETWITDRIFCLLIAHRSTVVAHFMMERASGRPMAVDGPIVVPGKG